MSPRSQFESLAVALHAAALAALNDVRIGEAQRLAAEAVDMALAAFGVDSPDAANVLLTCAIAEEAAGDFDAARTQAEGAAIAAAPLRNSDDPEMVSLWVDIELACAGLMMTSGDFDSADHRLAAALNTASAILPADDTCLRAIHNLRGVTAKNAGRFDDAHSHYQKVQAVLEAQPDIDDEELATLLHNLGGLNHSRGRIAEGLSQAERGLQLRTHALGPHHPDVARDLNALGALHHDDDNDVLAVEAYRQALKVFVRVLGPSHYEVGMTCANLAVSSAGIGDLVESRQLYTRAIAILESALPAEHPDVALVLHNYALFLTTIGETEEALELLTRAEAIMAATLTEDHPRRRDLAGSLEELSPRSGEL